MAGQIPGASSVEPFSIRPGSSAGSGWAAEEGDAPLDGHGATRFDDQDWEW